MNPPRHLIKCTLCVLTVAALAACSQGGSATIPQPGISAASIASPDEKGRVAVRFRFKIPRHPGRGRDPRFVSPSTKSLTIDVYNASRTKRVVEVRKDTIPAAPGCSAVAGGTFSCRFDVNAPAGADRFDVTAFDGVGETGAKLSAIQDFPFTVVRSKLNMIPITLEGIPASLQIALVAASPLAFGSAADGFQFGGIGSGAAHQIQLTVKDYDGNIIANPGAPTVSLTNGAPTKLAVAAVSGIPGRFTLTPLAQTNALPAPNPSTAITLTAIAASARSGANPVKVAFTVQNDSIVYAALYGLSDVKVYAPWSSEPINVLPDPEAASYRAIAHDASGNVYVCNNLGGTVTVFNPGSTSASRTITGFSSPCYPSSIAIDTAGDIFVPGYDVGTGNVYEYTPAGGNTPSRIIPNANPSVALDKTGTLFVTSYGAPNVGVTAYAPGSSIVPLYAFSAGMSGPLVSMFDSLGNLYVVNDAGSNITEYRPPFSNASVVAKTFGSSSSISEPLAAAVDASGNVYVANDSDVDSVAEFTQSSPTTPIRNLSVGSFTGGVAIDQLQNAYVTAYDAGAVSAYPPGTSVTAFKTWTTDATHAWTIDVWP